MRAPVQAPGEPSGAGRTGRAARSHLPGINQLKPAALLLPPLPTFTRVALAKSRQQVSAGGDRHALSKLGTFGNWSATEPVPATGDTAHAKVDGEAHGEESTPCQRRDS